MPWGTLRETEDALKKALLLFSLLVVLAAPAMAAPRESESGNGVFNRLVLLLKRLVLPAEQIIAGPPKP